MSPRTLHQHQAEALQMLRSSIASGKRRPVLQASTGYGKTVLAGEIINRARAKGKKVVFVVPAISLVDQTVASFHRDGIEDIGVIQADHHMTDWSKAVQVASIQTIARRGYPEADLVLIDECHRLFDAQKKWMQHPDWQKVPFIGLSATPWTSGLGKVYDDLIISATTEDLIKRGFLSPFRVYAPSHPDLSGVRTVAGDYHEGDLGGAMNKAILVADVVETWMRLGEWRPTLAFAVDCAHAKHIQRRFEDAGIPCGYIDAHTEMADRNIVRDKFKRGEYKVVANVGTLTTGVDWDVRCIILARPTKSEMLFCLDSETEILTSHGWMGMGEIRAGDCVAACDGPNTKAGRWSRVTGVVQRSMTESESWVEYKAPRANFRVTDRHRMIFRGALERGDGFRIAEASEMAACKGGAYLPTAVHFQQSGTPLTDDELYFVGMMMADGTWTSTAGSISQSERHPEIITRIESCLKGCGIGYAKRRVVPSPSDSMCERFPRWVFYFSAGKPKPHGALGKPKFGNELKAPYEFVVGTTGYRHLLPYLDKDMAPALMQMSKSQFIIFLSGLWDGDGAKKLGVDYTPRSLEICSSRPMLMDRLQALCAINGMTANVRTENGASRSTPIHLITITDKDWRSCGGYSAKGKGGRPQIEVKPATNEMVWCVESESGTIVTRRRGKVTVMGNCQIIGRGLRTAEGKDHCIILDHSDTHSRLGFVTDIHHESLSTGADTKKAKARKEALPKECPKCAYLRPPKVSLCPACGHKPEAPTGEKEVEDGDLSEIVRGKGTKDGGPKNHVRMGGVWIPNGEFFGQLRYIAKLRGYKDGWAAQQYKMATGTWPNYYSDSPAIEATYEVSSWVKSRQIAYSKSKAKLDGGSNARP